MGVIQIIVEAIHLLSGIGIPNFVPATEECLKWVQRFGKIETEMSKSLRELARRVFPQEIPRSRPRNILLLGVSQLTVEATQRHSGIETNQLGSNN